MNTKAVKATVMRYQKLEECVRAYALERRSCMAAYWRAPVFRATEGEPMTLRRAKALNAVLENCDLPVWPGELLVGIGRQTKMSPAGTVSDDALKEARTYCDSNIGARVFQTHSDHHAPDYATLLGLGFDGLRQRVRSSMPHHQEPGRVAFLDSVEVALNGASAYMMRWAKRLRQAAEEDAFHRELLLEHADSMEHLANGPARSFREAMQLVYSYHSMMQIDDRGAMAFGRVDQFIYPYYRADIEAGRIDNETAQSVLDHFFTKVTIDPDVQNIAIGGVMPKDGSDATNELSFMILEACRRVGKPGGNITARIHKNTPPAFLEKCAEVIATGVGYPAVFNDEVEIPALVDRGYPLEHARDYCFAGCIEAFIPGRMAPWADSRFNLPHCLNLAIYDGIDSLTGEQVGPQTGEPVSWDELYAAFQAQMRDRLRAHIEEMNNRKKAVEDRAEDFTSPLMSATVDSCIDRGLDVNQDGAIHPANHGIGAMGIGTVSDCLMALRKLVYEEKRFTLAEMRKMLDANFEGYEVERQILLKGSPKYGNDDDTVDQIAVQVTREIGEECFKYRTPRGGQYWALMAANVQNISAGAELAATPDGRFSKQPLSDAASPTFGRDTNGPTAVIHSIAKLPYHYCPGGNVVNMKLHPSAFSGPQGTAALAALIRACFNMGGIEMQFNTVDREVLIQAMQQPEKYQNLVVRVSGFSYNYTWLAREVQEDILARTEYRQI